MSSSYWISFLLRMWYKKVVLVLSPRKKYRNKLEKGIRGLHCVFQRRAQWWPSSASTGILIKCVYCCLHWLTLPEERGGPITCFSQILSLLFYEERAHHQWHSQRFLGSHSSVLWISFLLGGGGGEDNCTAHQCIYQESSFPISDHLPCSWVPKQCMISESPISPQRNTLTKSWPRRDTGYLNFLGMVFG